MSPFSKNVSRIQKKRYINDPLLGCYVLLGLTFEHPRMNKKNSIFSFSFKLVCNICDARDNRNFEFIIWVFFYEYKFLFYYLI